MKDKKLAESRREETGDVHTSTVTCPSSGILPQDVKVAAAALVTDAITADGGHVITATGRGGSWCRRWCADLCGASPLTPVWQRAAPSVG